jgi:hypothetical protein
MLIELFYRKLGVKCMIAKNGWLPRLGELSGADDD